MQRTNFEDILKNSSFFINGTLRSGKITFMLFLASFLMKKKTLVFTPQESFLFKRKLLSLQTQFQKFHNLTEQLETYHLKEQWHTLKQHYGFEFFIEELKKVIQESKAEVIIMHRFTEFFEFQDRYEIEKVYKALIKHIEQNKQKIIFVASSESNNYEYVANVAENYTDTFISIEVLENNQRILHIKDLLHNQEFPAMIFEFHDDTFVLDYYKLKEDEAPELSKNILIAELDKPLDNLKGICHYIFQKPGFVIKTANSLQTILQEVFVRPDILVLFMERTKENLQTVKTIKEHLPHTVIIVILNQDFLRAEDAQSALRYGIDELFCQSLSLNEFIISAQKAVKELFYTNETQHLPKYNNILQNKQELKKLTTSALKHSLYFTLISFEIQANTKFTFNGRSHDYIFIEKNKVYYFALNTTEKEVPLILKKYQAKESLCLWEPLHTTPIEECF